MPLVTNRCNKHKNAYPEDECPKCAEEETEQQRSASKLFFENYGTLDFFDLIQRVDFSVEDLYQHIRARLLEELSPTLMQAVKGYKP